MPYSAINDITPNNAFKEKNHRTIYDINYQKSLKNNTVSDIDINDKVRILIKKQFQKVQNQDILTKFIQLKN